MADKQPMQFNIWRVSRRCKIFRFFRTQKEAIAFREDMKGEDKSLSTVSASCIPEDLIDPLCNEWHKI